VRDLGEHSRIVEFRLPSTIAAVTVEQLLDSAAEQESIDSSALYIGPAGAWSGCNPDSRAVSFIRLVEPLLSAESADSERAERTEAPAHEPSVHKGWSGRISGHAGTLQVPDPGLDEDIVVSTLAARKDPAVFLRRPVRSGMLGSELTIRVPTRLVGVKGQRVRVERQSPRSTQREDLLLTVPPSRLQPWMLSAFLNRGGGGNRVIRAFAESVGCRIAYAEDEPAKLRDIPVVWGVLRGSDRILAQAKTQGLYYFYIDHAYFDRGHGNSYRITRNGYEAGAIRDCPEDRLTRLKVTTREWRKSGREIIVCPPTEYFMTSHGCPNWLEDTLRALQGITDRPIIIREKPKAGGEAVPLPQALESAHALVTHSSNVAIEAVCLGTPVFVASSSAAAPVGQTDLRQIETPAYPDRQAWLCHLAYNQFSIDEIGDGSAWRMLLDFEERPLV
jgi:hypothetical protein